jgi:hypothetical protein
MYQYTKTETEIIKIKVDFRAPLEYNWSPGTAYDTSDYVRPIVANGFEYQCTTGGQTGSSEPTWPTTLAGTVADGSITWTAVAYANNAADTISSANIEAPTGVTVGTPVVDGPVVIAAVYGGTSGTCYIISFEATTSAGELFEEKIELVISGD